MRAKYQNNVLQATRSYPVTSSTVARSVRGQEDAFRISRQDVISCERITCARAFAADPADRSGLANFARLRLVRAVPVHASSVAFTVAPGLALGTPGTPWRHPIAVETNVIDHCHYAGHLPKRVDVLPVRDLITRESVERS
jgi:hypothetical protein